MQYVSTRAACAPVSPSVAVLEGLAPDGGLYLPEQLPGLCPPAQIAALGAVGQRELTAKVIAALLPDIGYEAAARAVELGYGDKFDGPELTSLVPVKDAFVLELWHGPTSAFKDMALCVLPRLMAAAREQNHIQEELLILTATSGDTGKAALAGFSGAPHAKVMVFYPERGVSAVQKAQMVTQEGENVTVCAVRGDFDDAQRGVKRALGDFHVPGVRATSANSINVGRLAPQAAYYFAAYGKLLARGAIRPGDKVNFVVPTGNFGNILAGYLAKRMGLPIGKLVCASNENDVLYEFLSTGVYNRASRRLIKTASPSMDILVSSNLERLLYYMAQTGSGEGDGALLRGLMGELNENGRYRAPEGLLARIRSQGGFLPARCAEAEAFSAIRTLHREEGYLMDPHTAVAWQAYETLREGGALDGPTVVLSTASPFKFAPAMLEALGLAVPENGFSAMEELALRTGLPIPRNLAGLKEKTVLHRDVIDPADMKAYIIDNI